MSIINETNYKRIQDILVGGLQYYPRTTTDYVWDPERKKTLKDVLDDISGGGGGSPGGPVSWSNIQNKPNTLFGFGILDAYTKSEVDSLILNIPTGVSTWGDIQNKPAWIGSSKPSYTAAEVGAVSINAELFSGNYQDLANKPILGSIASKNSITISDINATGSASSTTFLAGDGVWKVPSGGGGSSAWGSISGNIAAQTDLANALNNKVEKELGKGLSSSDYTTAEKNKLSNIESGAQVNSISSVAGKTGVVTLAKTDVGLGSVDNTSDVNKPISTAQQSALNGKANTVHTHEIGQISDFPEILNLVGGSNITVVESGNDIIISSSGGGEPAEKINLVAGSNITIQESGQNLIISSSGGGGGGDLDTVDVVAGSGIDITSIGGTLTISSTGGGGSVDPDDAMAISAGEGISLNVVEGVLIISSSGGGGGGSAYISEEQYFTLSSGDITDQSFTVTLSYAPVMTERRDVFLNGILIPNTLISLSSTQMTVNLSTLSLTPIESDFVVIKYSRA